MTKATNNVARVAAAVAGFGLVAMSFAPLAGAQTATTATTTTTTTTTTATFTRDLTIGSTGADVTALQTWLMAKGFSIPAGATGYFGAQTKAALAAYQAANMITPAAGYFGPITRAKVAADTGTTTTGGTTTGGTTTTTTTTTLKGGEADLTKYDLRSGDGEGDEGEEDVELATVKFDVDGGDISVQRVELTASSTDDDIDQRPWQYFDTISVYADGKKLGDVDASDRDEWDEESDDVYTITISDLDYVVNEDDQAELTFMADISDSIDTADQDQNFKLAVLRDGIRAVDAAGIQQYVGDSETDIRDNDTDTVSFSFGAEDNGDLTIRESDENPDSSVLKVEDDETSDEYTVFVFEARNSGDADALITDLDISTNNTGATSTRDIIRRATLSVDGDDFDGDIGTGADADLSFDDIDVTVDADDTVTFELMVEFTSQQNHYLNGDTISFSVDADADVEAEGADSGDELTGSDLSGSAESEVHTLSTTGFDVQPVSTSQSATTPDTTANSTGTFTIKFDVTADEDDPTYIAPTAANASSTNGTQGAIYRVMRNGTTTGITAFTSENSTLTSSARMSGGAYRVNAGDTETFTLTVTINPSQSGLFAVELYQVNYADTAANASNAANNSTFNVDTDNSDFETDPVNIDN